MKLLKMSATLLLLIVTLVSPARANHTYVPPVDRSEVPVLAGRTTIFGDESGWTRVRLPRPIDPLKIDWVDYRISGRGRVIAAFLLQEIDGETPPRGADVFFIRFGDCPRKACKPKPFSEPWMSATTKDEELPAGIYRLYLVVDGAPGEVYFETPELPGVARINPTKDVTAKVKNLTPRLVSDENGSFIFSAGDKSPFQGKGIALQSQWADPVGAGVFDWGTCVYENQMPANHETAYLPLPDSCPTLPSWHLWAAHAYTPLSDGCCWGVQQAMEFLPKAMGNWYTTTGPVEDFGASAMWLKLN